MKIQSSYQKLKTKIEEQDKAYKKLKADFKKYHNGDFQTKTLYGAQFKMEDDFEQLIWSGNLGWEGEVKNG